MKSFFEKHPNESAQSVVEKFIDHLYKWSGKSQQTSFDDDLTLLVVDVVPK